MSTAIAFLSGKGGSGKTTLALSIADLLNRSNVKTLLIDCDLSTNGATYFYESRLINRIRTHDNSASSFSELLYSDCSEFTIDAIQVNDYLDFFPAISEIPDPQFTADAVRVFRDLNSKLKELMTWAKQNYSIVLFDCQAGYTELLPALLPLMDSDLFVLEADSISASAMRNLFLKIGAFLGNAKLYQVFNKATPEEYDIYSKIVGTFFVNIGTLLFDWKIRQAFSRSQIPDLENTSEAYGENLYSICKILVPDMYVKKKLDVFPASIRYRKAEEEIEEVAKKIRIIVVREKVYNLLSILWLILAPWSLFQLSKLNENDMGFGSWLISLLALVCISVLFVALLMILEYFIRDEEKNVIRNEWNFLKIPALRRNYESKLEKLKKEMNNLEQVMDKKSENQQS